MERVAFLVDDTGERIDCLLNPESFEVRRIAGVRPHTIGAGQLVGAGRGDDPLLFTGGGRTEVLVDLVFDVDLVESRTPPDDVRTMTGRLWDLAENVAEQHGTARPPLVRLVWGKSWNIPAVVVAVAERFDSIGPTGVPRRSWLRMKLVRVAETASGPVGGHDADSSAGDPYDADLDVRADGQAARPTRSAVAALGDGAAEPGFSGVRFDLLASEALDSPLRWRELAQHNGIDNPMDVAAGTVLAVPGHRREVH
ncbi:hypothetical protein ACN27F_32845 [Solwaraspora sp. WMMB335]|uniref:CIS tube protein n=1 Tax=Solwaraspora sp. WMMB335 TaxID=3404118 RepID=UPI003B95E411